VVRSPAMIEIQSSFGYRRSALRDGAPLWERPAVALAALAARKTATR
jgi:hypothetical protein